MATNPDAEKDQSSNFFKDFNIVTKAAVSHPRFRDTVVPSVGVCGVAVGATGNLVASLGIALLAFALLDKRK